MTKLIRKGLLEVLQLTSELFRNKSIRNTAMFNYLHYMNNKRLLQFSQTSTIKFKNSKNTGPGLKLSRKD